MKKIINKTLLIWDIENIPYKFKNEIFNILPYLPEKKYVVSKKDIPNKIINYLKKENIRYFSAKIQKTADDKILEILKISLLNVETIIIVSSDSDFVNFVLKNSNGKKFHFIMTNHNSKRIMMTSKIDNTNIKYNVIGDKDFINKKKINKKKNKLNHKVPGTPLAKQKEVIYKPLKLPIRKETNKKTLNDRTEIIIKIKENKIKEDKKLKTAKKHLDIFNNSFNLALNKKNWLDIETKKITDRFNFLFSSSVGKCNICNCENLFIKDANSYNLKICKKCNAEWIQESSNTNIKLEGVIIKHKERFLNFYYKKQFEFLLNGEIIYWYDTNFNQLELALSKIRLPDIYLENKEEEENILYFQDEDDEDSEENNIFNNLLKNENK